MNASTWQYNHEWTRDSAIVATGLAALGHFEVARAMLNRLMTHMVTDEGDAIDSGVRRPYTEVELDQNGFLLDAIAQYVDWTGDVDFVRLHWDRIVAVANFPLSADFERPGTVLRCNRREFWERHSGYGVEEGFELTHQVMVSHGLKCAAKLARLVERTEYVERWLEASAALADAILNDPEWGFVKDGKLMKRRGADGGFQETIRVPDPTGYPEGISILEEGPHLLDPDTSSVFPILTGLTEPKGAIATRTLEDMDTLWNQTWDTGGYPRYNVTSEPDAPGSWPFVCGYMARVLHEHGDDEKVWRVLRWLYGAPGSRSGAWFEFIAHRPRPVPPWPQVGVIPWAWAELGLFFVRHLLGVRPDGDRVSVRPRLLAGMDHVSADIRVGSGRIKLTVATAQSHEEVGVWLDGQKISDDPSGTAIDMPSGPVEIRVSVGGQQ
jgi:GH15 family glucan-1,4-alpha-glucosidase